MSCSAKVGLAERRHHRPSELSGRRAAARRDRARAGLPADDPLRRRADRQPRLEDRRRDPRAAARLSDAYGQTIVMVTHDPRAAAIADRILFLADGLIVKELTEASAGRRARGDEHRSSHDPRRAQGPARTQAAGGADLARDRAGRRDGQRHLRPHRHDQGRVLDRLHDRVQERRRRRHRQERDRELERGGGPGRQAPVAPRLDADAQSERCPRSPQRRAGSRTQAQLVGTTAR